MPLVLGIDSSTQSTKVEVRDADSGELVATGRAPHPPTSPPRSEQDPEVWWDALQRACADAGAPAGDVAAIAVAGQQHGMVVLDADGAVVRPAKLWNDTESAPDAAWLVKQLDGPDAWANRCGSVPVAAFTITKLSWLHRSEPDAWARLDRVCLPHDWLTYRLTGAFVTDRGDASGTGYYAAADGAYCADLLAVVERDVDWTPRLPRVAAPGETVGTANLTGRDAVVGPGTGDNMAAALGVSLRRGDVAISIGTSGTVYTVSDQPTFDATGAVAGFADATGRFLPLVCTLNATKVTDAFARLLGVDHEQFDALALAAPPGANGTVVLPYFDGERTPNLPDATGSLSGLRSDVTREHVARAAVEGVVCGLLDGLDALAATGVAVDGRVVLLGGGAHSAAYRRVAADFTGRPVVVPDRAEYVAAGACVQAAAVLHGSPPEAVAYAWNLDQGAVVEPHDIDRETIRAAYREANTGILFTL
ncbi:MAG: xylulokinase [Actinomycetota bacterium]|nr:xylulokinase [Actinomycetota bacterium]